jgi:mRNA interferase RelE/StbE
MRLIHINKRSQKFIDKLPPKQTMQVVKKLHELKAHPFPNDCIKLQPAQGMYRVTAGEYRIVYSVLPNIIEVLAIGKRNDKEVYKLITH